jgi:hypothetical protein
MQQLTPAGSQAVHDLAQRYGVSIDAVTTLLFAVSAGGGTMAQFYHSELGGGGQWMRGGMTMVGDIFNRGLQSTVSGLCSELSSLLANQQVFAPSPASGAGSGAAPGNAWWPAELGNPSSSGGQNNARYAYFPQAQRLAISRDGRVLVYDTLNHQIGGVQQQQGGSAGSLSFSSQFGTFTVDSLPLVSPQHGLQTHPPPLAPMETPYQPGAPAAQAANQPPSHNDVLNALERLGDLRGKGVLTDNEFNAKKAELLARL